MDEPLSNLDAKLRVSMRSEIIKLHKAINATTIYVTHDQTEAMTMASRIVVMKDGYIQQIGTPEEIYDHPNNTFVATFIGAPMMNLINVKYQKGIINFNNILKIKLTDEQIKKHDDFYQKQIELLQKQIDNKEYEKFDFNLILTYQEEKFSLKNLFKKKTETKKILTPEEKLNALKKQIDYYKNCLAYEHDIIFGIRPEDIYDVNEIASTVLKSERITSNISVLELLGSEYHIHMNFLNIDLIAKCKVTRHLNDQEKFTFVFDLNKMHLFDINNKLSIM